MRKIQLLSTALLMLALTANAQDKNAAKAEKAAAKEAQSVLKKAKQNYEMSIPNAQYGRKETNFEKMDGAKNLIDQALNNKYTSNDPNTYKVAADIYFEYFKKNEEAAKTDESLMPQFISDAEKVLDYSIKYDSLVQLDPKKKDAEKTFVNEQYRNVAANPLLQCLQASQNYSNGETQEDFKKGYNLSTKVLNAFTKSHLFSTFKNDNLEDWILYSKTFRAQSLASMENAKPADVEEAYKQLYGTKYESVAFSSLINYYQERDKAKYMDILKYAYENAKDENAASFSFMYMQSLYQNDKKDECEKVIDVLVKKYPDNDNTLNAYLMKGQIMFEKKKFDEAEKYFEEVAQKYPKEEAAITMPAKCAWMKAQNSALKADREHAIKLFKDLEAKYPDNPDLWGEPLYILYNNNNQLQLRDKYKKYYKG